MTTITQEQAAGELLRRREARSSLIKFAEYVYPGYQADPMHILIANTLDRVIAGELRRVMFFAPPQHGKCIAKGSPVLMADGSTIPIEDVRPSSMVVSVDAQNNVTTARVVESAYNGVKPVFKITLHSGRHVVCTENHPLLTVGGWINAGDLHVGDHVATLRQTPHTHGAKLPDGLASLIGYLVGDGSYNNGGPYMTASDPAVVAHLESIATCYGWVLRPHGDYGYYIVKPKRGKRDGTSLREVLRNYMQPAKSATKRVPTCIFSAPKEDVRDFLTAYFNCDATVTDKREGVVEYYSTSELLLRDVQILLTRFGIYSRLRLKKGKYRGQTHLSWRLIISGEDMLRFADEMPAVGKRGEKLRAVALRFRDKPRNAEHNVIPNGWQSYLKHSLWWHRQQSGIRADKNYKFGVARHIVGRIAQIEDNEDLRKTCNHDIVWGRIVNIEYLGEQPTYDLQIADTQNFVVDNIIVHNSLLTSEIFPAYALGRKPDSPVIISSYAADLAEAKSRNARAIVEGHEFRRLFGALGTKDVEPVETSRHSRAVDEWRLAHPYRGGVRAVGVGGGVTGFPGAIGIIDDPVSGWKDALSAAKREEAWNWYRSVLLSRIWEGGAIILIMTRWHQSDLAGKLLASQPGRWTVIRLPALAETQEERDNNNRYLGLPIGEADPLERAPGEAVAPHRFSKAALEEKKIESGSVVWSALFDGVPRPAEGGRFKRPWFKIIHAIPAAATSRVRYWDKAGSESDGAAFTAGVLIARHEGKVYIEDVVRGRWSAYEREQVILQTAQLDEMKYGSRYAVKYYVEQEPGSGGKESAENTIRSLAGYIIERDLPAGNKDARLEPFAAQAEAGNVYLLAGLWNEDYIEEMVAIPNGAFRDQGDATAGSFNKSTAAQEIPFQMGGTIWPGG